MKFNWPTQVEMKHGSVHNPHIWIKEDYPNNQYIKDDSYFVYLTCAECSCSSWVEIKGQLTVYE